MSVGGGASSDFTQANLVAGGDIKIETTVQHIDTPDESYREVRLLEQYAALSAAVDSKARFRAPKCLEGTRKSILQELDSWAEGKDQTTRILLLRGPAGAGKSAIAQTFAMKCLDNGLLAASFFFSRNISGLNDMERFIPSLTYQLLCSDSLGPTLQPHIAEALKGKGIKWILNKPLESQIQCLVIQPLVEAFKKLKPEMRRPFIFLIDGLDECSKKYEDWDPESQQEEIINAITFAVTSEPTLPIRFFIASRPEPQIRRSFDENQQTRSLTTTIALDYTPESVADIELYLKHSFQDLTDKKDYLKEHPRWSQLVEEATRKLLEKSSGHFIYASVVMQFLSRDGIEPEEVLPKILDAEDLPGEYDLNTEDDEGLSEDEKRKRREEREKGRLYAKLDNLYLVIMGFISPQSLACVNQVFETLLVYAQDPSQTKPLFKNKENREIEHLSPEFFDRFLFLGPRKIYHHLHNLHSILVIPDKNGPPAELSNTAIRFAHASFTDFLTNPHRGRQFYQDLSEAKLRVQEHRFLHILRHVFLPNTDTECYLGPALVDELLRSLQDEGIPPSVKLAHGLAALISDKDEELVQYLSTLEPKPDTDPHIKIGFARGLVDLKTIGVDPRAERNASILSQLRHEDKLAVIVNYLERCGIKIYRRGYLRTILVQLWFTIRLLMPRFAHLYLGNN